MAGTHAEEGAAIAIIVDDDDSIRKGISSILRSVGIGVREYASADEFLRAPSIEGPGCLILDVRLPGISGLAFQAQMPQRGLRLPVVIITGYGDIPMSARAFKAGAVDFLTKPFRDQDLIDAVMSATQADRARRLRERGVARLASLYETLTTRERHILGLVCEGLLNKQIAGRLELSEITVKVHRGQVMKKMGAQSLPDLVRMLETLKHAGVGFK